MPHTVEAHKFGRLSRRPQYDKYLDGQIYVWTEEELEELSNGAQTVRSGVYSAAARNNMSVRTQIVDGELYVQATEKEE